MNKKIKNKYIGKKKPVSYRRGLQTVSKPQDEKKIKNKMQYIAAY